MSSPLISVIIPAYNAEETLERCLQSIRQQDYPEFEIVLVDDGSTDRTGEISFRAAAEDPRIRVIQQENRGVSGARNAGIEAARGEYLSFLDADDEMKPSCLSYLYGLIQSDPDCRIAQSNHWVRRGTKEVPDAPAEDRVTVFTRQEAAEAVLFHDRVDVSPWGKLYHRSVFDSLRYPEGRIFEDTWLFGELLKKTGTYVYGDLPQVHYIIREGSLTTTSFSLKNLQYIEAAEKLAADMLKIAPGCRAGAVRRINHARLSVLRYMQHCTGEELALRKQLREQVLKEAPIYLEDPRTPKRDRIAVSLLRMGFRAFDSGWSLYTKLRG